MANLWIWGDFGHFGTLEEFPKAQVRPKFGPKLVYK